MYPQLVTQETTGHRGRPRKVIDSEELRRAFGEGHNTSIAAFARDLHVDRKTVRRNLQELGLTHDFDDFDDDSLDTIIRSFFRERPDSGYSYCHGYIRSLGHRIQRDRILASINRVRPLASLLRTAQPITRRSYNVVRPNAVWHCDGYHKLIRYGIVVHGFIDGYCRTVSTILSEPHQQCSTCEGCCNESQHTE